MSDDRRLGALAHVRNNAEAGDAKAVLDALDDYAINHEFLMNVGPEKGPLLGSHVHSLPAGARVLELGCFCGYSATPLLVSSKRNKPANNEQNPRDHSLIAIILTGRS